MQQLIERGTQRLATSLSVAKDLKVIVPTYISEYWTPKQRQGHSLHEIPYRACFKPQLPKYFINKLTKPGDTVYDPFMGRGTTLVEGALLGRNVIGCDVNPLSVLFCRPRLNPIVVTDLEKRFTELSWAEQAVASDDELLAFYHPETLSQLYGLRDYLRRIQAIDALDDWTRMVALSRLTGHSSTKKADAGYFSVYTLPPNQAASISSQRRINKKRNNKFFRKDLKKIILKKSKSLLRNLTDDQRKTLSKIKSDLYVSDCRSTPKIADKSVKLIVTSPPFLDIVDYKKDNWLRCWFANIDLNSIHISQFKKVEAWRNFIMEAFVEFKRILKDDGTIAFEVGEAKGIDLEKEVVRAAINAGLRAKAILINNQTFTKTSNIWGVDNNRKGTNTNRIIVIQKS